MFYLTMHSTHFMDQSYGKGPHTMAFVTLVMEHWLEIKIAQWVYHEGMCVRACACVWIFVYMYDCMHVYVCM